MHTVLAVWTIMPKTRLVCLGNRSLFVDSRKPRLHIREIEDENRHDIILKGGGGGKEKRGG